MDNEKYTIKSMNLFSDKSKVLRVVDNNDDLLSDENFKVIFSEPVVALNFLRIIAPDIIKVSVDELKSNLLSYEFSGINRLTNKSLTKELVETTKERMNRSGRRFTPDVVFELALSENTIDMYTIDIEMQKETENYDMLSRALYYTASMTTDVLKKGMNYDKMHKVYSFWFLGFNYFADDIAVHSISPRAYYNLDRDCITSDFSKHSAAKFASGADLMEIVFIELKKRNKIRNSEELKKLIEIICKLDSNIFISLKTLFNVSEKEAKNMMEAKTLFDETMEEGEKRGEKKGEKRGEKRGLMLSLKVMELNNMGRSPKEISDELDMDLETINSFLESINKIK